jgi:hypothetical protein
MKAYETLSTDSLIPQFRNWNNVLKHNQTCHVFFLPHTGLLYRATQFHDWINSLEATPVRLINMDIDLIGDPFTFRSFLDQITTPALLFAGKNFFSENKIALANVLQSHYVRNKTGLIIFHEGSPLSIKSISGFPSIMFQNQFIYSLPIDQPTIKSYIENFSAQWHIPATDREKQEIADFCGNQPWITNEVLRLKDLSDTDSVSKIIQSPSVLDRIWQLWGLFPEYYREYFSGSSPDSATNKKVENELTGFGYLNPQNRQPIGRWLSDAIKNSHYTALKTTDKSLIFNQQNISHKFSAGEIRIIHQLFSSHTPVSREQIAKCFWQEKSDELYSDWALDAVISRLRKKVAKFRLPLSIKTVRGIGYGTN